MIATITTSKRPELFRKTISSFVSKARDWRMFEDRIVLFDDASTVDQRNEMMMALMDNKQIGLFSEPLNDAPIGHAANMQRVWEFVTNEECDDGYWNAHEDDWLVTSEGCPILAAMDVLINNPKVGQVCYGIARNNDWKVKRTRTGTSFTIRPNKEGTDPKPAFTLNPSLMRIAAFKDVGNFENTEGFEAEYGLRWQEKGWLTAELVPYFLQHCGDGRSAYDLNGTKR